MLRLDASQLFGQLPLPSRSPNRLASSMVTSRSALSGLGEQSNRSWQGGARLPSHINTN